MKKYINIKYWILGWMFVLVGFVNVTFAQTTDLTTHQPIASPPSGTTFEWHNALPISTSNLVASPTAVIPGFYYGVYNFGTCYSEAAPIRVATNICPVTTVDLNSFVETTGTPSGMTLTFHNASPVSDANSISGSAITAAAPRTYYVAYRDNIVGCYSTESLIVVVNSSCLAVILAVTDSPSVLPGTNTPSVIGNDTLNGVQAVIGTSPGQVTLTSTPNGPLTMNLATGTIAVAANTPAGSYPITYTICEVSNPTNCSTVTSNVTVTAPVIAAVTETTAAINGSTGGSTPALTTNDTLNGLAVTIGTTPGNVKMTTGTLPAGITVNTATGIVTIAPNTPAGYYPISYTICEVNNPTNCNTVTSTIVVSAPIIDANQDTAGSINGATGATNVANVLTNDTLNSSAVSIGQINLTTVTPNSNLTLNADGSIDVAPNTLSGTYTLTYQICDKSNPTNCSQATVLIVVIKELPDFTPTIDIDALVFVAAGNAKDFVVNISEIKGAPSDGQVIVKIIKQSAFLITYGATTSTSNVNGGVSVNNTDWMITENGSFITMTLKTGIIIGANAFSGIGFTIARKPDVPAQTSQSITVTILNGSGSDIYNFNNTYNTIVKAQ
jgi:hypothetical protein